MGIVRDGAGSIHGWLPWRQMSCRLNSFWAGAAWYLRGDRTAAVSMAANRSWAAAPESSHPAASSLATAAADMVAGEEQGISYCKRPISANGVLEAAISARRLFVVISSKVVDSSRQRRRSALMTIPEPRKLTARRRPIHLVRNPRYWRPAGFLPSPCPPQCKRRCVCVQRCNLRGRRSRLKGSGQGPELSIHHSGLFPETHLIHRQSHCNSRGKKLISWDPQSGLFLRWAFLDAFSNPYSTTLRVALSRLDSGVRLFVRHCR